MIITPVLVRSEYSPYIFFVIFDYDCPDLIDTIVNDNKSQYISINISNLNSTLGDFSFSISKAGSNNMSISFALASSLNFIKPNYQLNVFINNTSKLFFYTKKFWI